MVYITGGYLSKGVRIGIIIGGIIFIFIMLMMLIYYLLFKPMGISIINDFIYWLINY